MIRKNSNSYYLAVSSVIVVILFLITSKYITIPNQLITYAEIFPKQKWIVTRTSGGQFQTDLVDYSKGITSNYIATEFNRGEFISAEIHPKKNISKGDTVLVLNSASIEEELINTTGQLKIALAELKAQSSPSKKSLIKEAESKLKYYQKKLEEEKILFDRTLKLYEKEIASKQEFELAKLNKELLEIEVRKYKAQLENLTTGVKPSEVKYLYSKIEALKERLKYLSERKSKLIFTSPINGTQIPSFSADTLLNITNTNQVVLHIPVKLEDKEEIENKNNLSIEFSGNDITLQGKVLNVGNQVEIINGRQIVFVSILVDNNNNKLLPGMIVKNSLQLGNTTLFEKLKKTITR